MIVSKTKFVKIVLLFQFIIVALNVALVKYVTSPILLAVMLVLTTLVFSHLLIKYFYRRAHIYKEIHSKLRGDFVANISHEIKTPLTSISGYIQMLESTKDELNSTQLDYLDRISANASRLHDLFHDVLELSELENEADLDLEIISTRDFILDIQEDVKAKYLNKNITISNQLGDIQIEGDQKYLQMVFTNLMGNALKYSREGEKIFVTTKADADRFIFCVRDKGPGVADTSRVFERFYREESARKSKITGTGLGLAIAKHAVNRHNGRIWCVSALNQGTSFFVELPIFQNPDIS